MSMYPIFQTKQEKRPRCSDGQRDKNQSIYLIYISQLANFLKIIEVTKETLSQELIWPDQCDYIIYRIKLLQKTATKIAGLAIKQTNKSLGYNRYSTFVSANYFCEQSDSFIEFVREYKEISNQTPSKKAKHMLIISSLRHLESSLHDLIKELDKAVRDS